MSDFWRIILAAYTLAELEQLQRTEERLERLHALGTAHGSGAACVARINAYLGRDEA